MFYSVQVFYWGSFVCLQDNVESHWRLIFFFFTLFALARCFTKLHSDKMIMKGYFTSKQIYQEQDSKLQISYVVHLLSYSTKKNPLSYCFLKRLSGGHQRDRGLQIKS